MKIKPEDRPKMFGLLAAIGIMFCYLILVVIPSLSGAQAAPAPQDTPGAAPVATPTPASAPAPSPAPSPSKSGPAMMEAGPVPDAKNDPFLSPTPNPATAVPLPLLASSAPPGTARPIQAAGTTPLAASTQTTPPNVPKVSLPSLMLLGVAGGEEQVAVFQVGENTENTLEKKKGDTLPGGFTLQAIDGDGVTLTRGKAVCRLEVGHALNGAGK